MHSPARLGVERRDVARRAAGLALEERLPARGGGAVERPWRRSRRRNRKLVELQGRELRGDAVVIALAVAKTSASGDGELAAIVETGIEEDALSLHLVVRHVRVPVRHRAPARVGVQVDPGEPEGGGKQRRSRLAIGPERLPVDVQFGVELPRAPAPEHLLHRRLVDA